MRDTVIVERDEQYIVLDELPVVICAHVRTCVVYGSDIFDMELDNLTLTAAYRKAGLVEYAPGKWRRPPK